MNPNEIKKTLECCTSICDVYDDCPVDKFSDGFVAVCDIPEYIIEYQGGSNGSELELDCQGRYVSL